jgi:hypothetical protein
MSDASKAELFSRFAERIVKGPIVVELAQKFVWSPVWGEPLISCSNGDNAVPYHIIAVVGYDRANQTFGGIRTITIQNSYSYGNKLLHTLDFDTFVEHRLQNGCQLGWKSYFYPDGAQEPFALGPTTAPTELPPLRCDIDADGVDGYANGHEVDNCPVTPNPDQADADGDGIGDVCDQDSDLDGVPDYHDNCVGVRNPLQIDLDNDGLGDECDDDDDGDGIVDQFDCNSRNGCLGLDIDQDGVCDETPTVDPRSLFDCDVVSNCERLCEEYALFYYGESFLETCTDQCNAPLDNCKPGNIYTDAFCAAVRANCATPNSQTPCSATDVRRCAMEFANPLQENNFGDAAKGDQCEAGMSVALVTDYSGVKGFGSGLPLNFHCQTYGDSYRVEARLWDGHVGTNQFGHPVYGSVDHTAVEAGACACLPGDTDGWDQQCVSNDCRFADSELNSLGEKAWNPVQAPEIAAQKYFGPIPVEPKYPVICTGGPETNCDTERTSAIQNDLVFGRKMPFSRDRTNNFHRLTWSWPEAKQFPAYTVPVDYSYTTTGRTTRARAAWANFGQSYDGNFYDHLVSYTEPVEVRRTQSSCSSLVYLGPPFIVDFLRGVTDYWLDGRTGESRPPAGWLLGQEPESGRTLLYHLGPDTLQVEGVQELVAPEGVDLLGPSSAGDVGLLPGTIWGLDEAGRLAMAVYHEGRVLTHDGDLGTGPRLLLASLETGEEVTFEDLEVRYGIAIPALTDARVVVRSSRQQLLLIGQTSGREVVAYRLRLDTGELSGPYRLAALGDRSGYGLVPDPVRGRLLAFGGTYHRPDGSVVASAEVTAIDLDTLASERLAVALPETAARSRAGMFLDPVGRRLHVLGGTRDGEIRGDGFMVDLRTGEVEALSGEGGPGRVVEPFLFADRNTGRLYAGDVIGQAPSAGLLLHGLGDEGTWQVRTVPLVPMQAPSYPLADTYVPGRTHAYFTEPVAGATWPGQVLVAILDDGGLGLRVTAQTTAGEVLAESELVGAGVDQVGFRCPPGEACRLVVTPRPGAYAGGEVPFTLEVGPATLEPAGTVETLVPVEDLAGYGEHLVVSSVLGVAVLDPASLGWVGLAVRPELLLAQAATGCGGFLCVARLGLQGLAIVDLTNPAQPEVKGGSGTVGPGWDVAARGQRAYVAHGALGIGVYEVDGQGRPVRARTVRPGGVVRTVAVHGDVLAAAQMSGQVKLYRVGSDEELVGTIPAAGPVDRVRFVGGKLWVLRKNGQGVEVYSVVDPAAPVRLGSIETGAREAYREVWRGARRYTYQGHEVIVDEVVVGEQP